MTKMQRKQIREKIIEAIKAMTEEESNEGSVVDIGGHEIAMRLVYAGGSQWCGCGRDWDTTESGWCWIVDSQYRLTTPDLFGFDGHNMIEVQTGYYLVGHYDEQTVPSEPDGDPLDRVPNAVLIEIARGLADAKAKFEAHAAQSSSEAEDLIAKLA
jgi:hypothetical protein